MCKRRAAHAGECSARTAFATRWRFARSRFGRLAIALLSAVAIMNWAYGFEGTGRMLGDFEFLSTTLGGDEDFRGETGNRFQGTWLGNVPMPVPRELLQGIDYLKWEFEQGMPCYLFGQWQDRGWWYFYLAAMAVKFPIGYIVLILIGGGDWVISTIRQRAVRCEWVVPLMALILISLVSSQTGFTHHLRYVLPAFGFLYILAARSILILPTKLSPIVIGLCLLGTVCFHLTHIGQSHTHFNWLAGGPRSGWRHLALSNVDWGQSTYRMAEWARSHPELKPLTVVFVSQLGEPSKLVADLKVSTHVTWSKQHANSESRVPLSGWYLLSADQLTRQENTYFRTATPVSWPFADVVLFHVSESAETIEKESNTNALSASKT